MHISSVFCVVLICVLPTACVGDRAWNQSAESQTAEQEARSQEESKPTGTRDRHLLQLFEQIARGDAENPPGSSKWYLQYYEPHRHLIERHDVPRQVQSVLFVIPPRVSFTAGRALPATGDVLLRFGADPYWRFAELPIARLTLANSIDNETCVVVLPVIRGAYFEVPRKYIVSKTETVMIECGEWTSRGFHAVTSFRLPFTIGAGDLPEADGAGELSAVIAEALTRRLKEVKIEPVVNDAGTAIKSVFTMEIHGHLASVGGMDEPVSEDVRIAFAVELVDRDDRVTAQTFVWWNTTRAVWSMRASPFVLESMPSDIGSIRVRLRGKESIAAHFLGSSQRFWIGTKNLDNVAIKF